LLATDNVTQQNLAGYLGQGETESEITEFLIILRDDLAVNPEFIVIDYKPAWEVALTKIFPKALLIRCGFHTVQLVNRGILKELNQFSKIHFKKIIKEIRTLYQAIKHHIMEGEALEIEVKNPIVTSFHYFYTLIVELFKTDQLPEFKTHLTTILENLNIHATKYSKKLRDELIKRLPKKGLTEKSLKYYRQKVKGALSLVMRQFRRKLEEAQKEFNKVKKILLKRPENLSAYETKFLTTYLKMHSEFRKYRNLSMRISNIYHDPPEQLTPSIITEIELWAEVHPDLKKAIKTLKQNVEKIFNFLRLYSQKKFQKYPKISRVTPEPKMRKIKDLYRKKYGFRTVETTRLLLENQLNCPFFVSPL
jgi:hypothetical protein